MENGAGLLRISSDVTPRHPARDGRAHEDGGVILGAGERSKVRCFARSYDNAACRADREIWDEVGMVSVI